MELNPVQNAATGDPFEISTGPGKGEFILSIRNPADSSYNLFVFGHHGEKLWKRQGLRITGFMDLTIDLGAVTEGMYVMVIESNQKTWVRKLVVLH
jgi:hypothetical protein